MKYPPRFASRQRPLREPQPGQPRRLLAGAIFVAGFALAIFGVGAFHDVHSTGKEPTTHLPPGSPLPTNGSFQVLGNPQPSPTSQPALTLASPSPSAGLLLRQTQVVATPLAPLYAGNQGNPSPVQIWSSANLLTPAGPEVVVGAVAAPPAADPPAAVIATPIPTPTPEPPSTPTPSPQPSASPTPTSKPSPTPSPTPSPQPSTTPTPQPSPSGSPSCVPTRRHPCQPRGGNS